MFIILLGMEALALIFFLTVVISFFKKEEKVFAFPHEILEERRKLALNIAYVTALRNKLTFSVIERLVKYYK